MDDLISRQAAIDICHKNYDGILDFRSDGWTVASSFEDIINSVPSVHPERKKDTIQKYHDYQVEWLKSHYDIEFEPQLEEMIIRFLHDTANRYMMEEGE